MLSLHRELVVEIREGLERRGFYTVLDRTAIELICGRASNDMERLRRAKAFAANNCWTAEVYEQGVLFVPNGT